MYLFPQHENKLLFLLNNITNYIIGYSETILRSTEINSSNIVPRDIWVLNIDSGKERHCVEDPRVSVHPDAGDQPQDTSSVHASTICLIVLVVSLVIGALVFYLYKKKMLPTESYQNLRKQILKKLPW